MVTQVIEVVCVSNVLLVLFGNEQDSPACRFCRTRPILRFPNMLAMVLIGQAEPFMHYDHGEAACEQPACVAQPWPTGRETVCAEHSQEREVQKMRAEHYKDGTHRARIMVRTPLPEVLWGDDQGIGKVRLT